MGRVEVDFGVGQGAKRRVDIRSDLGQASNAGQGQNPQQPWTARGRRAAGGAARSLQPAAGDAPPSLLAVRPSASTRDPSQDFTSLLGSPCDSRETYYNNRRRKYLFRCATGRWMFFRVTASSS